MPTDAVRIVDADPSHAEAIRAIRNEVVANTAAIWEDEPASESEARDWFDEKRAAGLPLLVALDADGGAVLGFASYGVFNSNSGYRRTAEHSLHVAAAHRGRGLGRLLLDAIERRARGAGLHALVGLIDSRNEASRRLHESAGYTLAGTLPEVGWKFDGWRDLCYYHKLLD